MTFKWLTMPWSNETKEVESVQTWEVRWASRYSEYSGGTRPEVEVFTSKEVADEFATSLRNAFGLIRHTSGTDVWVQKSK